jgi:hypothetical protein
MEDVSNGRRRNAPDARWDGVSRSGMVLREGGATRAFLVRPSDGIVLMWSRLSGLTVVLVVFLRWLSGGRGRGEVRTT